MYVIFDNTTPLHYKLPQPIDTSRAECAVVKCKLPSEIKFITADFIEPSFYDGAFTKILFTSTTFNPAPVYRKVVRNSLETVSLDFIKFQRNNSRKHYVIVVHFRNY